MTEMAESELEKLRDRVERALERPDAASAALAASLLERMLTLAPEGSEDAIFAHRHLAELLLEKQPWKAALHVRRALVHDDADDALHAMMGLSQALLGNYRAAVGAYERAARRAPNVGWYHHNLGHLLDVALEDPQRAEAHLRTAYRLASHHDEVVASLAHCLARLDRRDEALELARKARGLKPNKPAHRDLVAWIEDGSAAQSKGKREAKASRPGESSRERDVAASFDEQMRLAGYADPVLEGAHQLWSDFSRGRTLRVVKTSVYAAAVEYAIALLVAWPGASQAAVARRYGVAATSVATRYAEIREALGLVPFDPRYTSKT